MEKLNDIYRSYAPQSKVWIFQADQALSVAEEEALSKLGNEFAQQWKAHGSDLKATCTVLFHHFWIFISDETVNKAGGCSIDKLVQFVKEEGNARNIDFLNRLLIAHLTNDTIQLIPMVAIPEAIDNGSISADSIIFNNTITSLEAFQHEWQIPLKKSFLKKYLKTEIQG